MTTEQADHSRTWMGLLSKWLAKDVQGFAVARHTLRHYCTAFQVCAALCLCALCCSLSNALAFVKL